MAITIGGCGLGESFSDLGDKLLSPDVQTFDSPGRRLFEGPHTALSVQISGQGEPHAMGLKFGGGLTLHNLLTEQQCEVSGVVRYPAEPLHRDGEPSLIPLVRRGENGETRLNFSTFACELQSLSLPNAGFNFVVLGVPESSSFSLLMRWDDQLHQIDPWKGEHELVAESLRGAVQRPFGYFQWIEAGKLSLRDENLQPIASIGENVLEAQIDASLRELAYLEREDTNNDAPDTGGRLYTVQALSTDEPELLETNACSLSYLRTADGVHLSYFAPCKERRLIFSNRTTGTRRIIADNVVNFSIVGSTETGASVTYLVEEKAADDQSPETALWLAEGSAEPVLMGRNALNASTSQLPNGDLLAMVDWQGAKGGRLIHWKNSEAVTVAENVAELGSLGRMKNGDATLLAHLNGDEGDILRLLSDGSVETLVEGFLRYSVRDGAYLGNYKANGGTLFTFDSATGESEAIATQVQPAGFRATQQWPGWMILSDSDDSLGGSTLTLHLQEPAREYEIHRGVTQVREVASPSRGVIYAISEGDSAGVWFSKAK